MSALDELIEKIDVTDLGISSYKLVEAARSELAQLRKTVQADAELWHRAAERVGLLTDTIAQLRGAMQADGELWRRAGERVGLPFGCDTPEKMADEIIRLRAQVAVLMEERVRIKTCVWTLTDKDMNVWETQCGNAFIFERGSENGACFCMYCGGKIV